MNARQRNAEHAVAEPLAPLGRSRHDWTARTRARARQAHRYSRFVVVMKRALPLAAAALAAAVLAYSLQPRQSGHDKVAMSFERLGVVNDDLAMLKPRLTGSDTDGNPYVVTAREAIQDRLNSKRARLVDIEGDISLKDGSWIGALATGGLLDAARRTLALVGAISLYSDSGYELHTTVADVDMAQGTVTGNRAVTGQGPAGTFRADRFRLVRERASKHAGAVGDSELVYFQGHVRMTIYAHGLKRT